MRGGSNTGIDYRSGYTPSGQRLRSGPSISRYNNSMAKFLKGTADPGDMLRLIRRGFFKPLARFATPIFERIPIIGGIIDFLVNFFLFKEPLGKSVFLAAGSTLGSLIGATVGTLIGGPAGTWVGGAIGGFGGDWAARALYDGIFGDNSLQEISGINDYADYELELIEINNIYLQPIET